MDSPVSITDQTPKEKPVILTSSSGKKNMFKFSFVNPKILGAMTVLLLLLGGIGAGVYLTRTPQQTVSQASIPTAVDLTFRPEQIEISAENEFGVDIFANANGNQITSADLTIKYDPQVLALKSIVPAEFLPKILVPPEFSEGSATISLGADGTTGVSGSGVIARLVFETIGNANGVSQISFDVSGTSINVLNRTSENVTDKFGEAQVRINIPDTQSPAPPSKSATPAPSLNGDINSDGVINSIDRSLMHSSPSAQTQTN